MVSLIIPSFNPALKLPQTLDALVSQKELIDELIIVTDNKNYSAGVKLMLEKYSEIFELKIIPQEISGRGRSRNTGAEASKGDLLIFLDDDMLAENDLIEKHIKYHHNNPGIIISGNGFRNPADANYDFGKFLIKTEQSWKANRSGKIEISLENFSFTASNMSLPKDIFQQLNGFDIRFSDGEDFDLAVRAINKGIKIVYDSTLLAWHNDWPDIKSFARRQAEYLKAKQEIAKIHPDYSRYFPPMFRVSDNKIKKIIAVMLKSAIMQFVTSENRIFGRLPLKIKFKLYELALSVNLVASK